jgi:hypothetical protein
MDAGLLLVRALALGIHLRTLTRTRSESKFPKIAEINA